jgi:hypothetical protein
MNNVADREKNNNNKTTTTTNKQTTPPQPTTTDVVQAKTKQCKHCMVYSLLLFTYLCC